MQPGSIVTPSGFSTRDFDSFPSVCVVEDEARGERLATVWELLRLYRAERPRVVHHVAMKPVIYGSIAARLAAVPVVINALAGLGFVFLSANPWAKFLRPVVTVSLRTVLRANAVRVIVQNSDDLCVLRQIRVPAQTITTIRGSGVDVSRYHPVPEPEGEVVVAMVSRMLWDKGVGEVVASARILAKWGVRARLWLVGAPDPENPASIDENQLRAWHDEGIVHWLGHREDVAEIWARSHVAVLPSYREGLPKSLLEAAAAARPIVATDVPGCREIVRDGETGVLVPVKDVDALALALLKLIEDPVLRHQMGARARELVLQSFTEQMVIEQTLALYRSALADR